MKLSDLMAEHKPTIVKKWFFAVVESYPPDTANFLKREKDPFANPVGSTVVKEIESIFDHLLEGGDRSELTAFLDGIIRVRAVQDFTPSQALVFIPMLKDVVRKVLAKQIRSENLYDELNDFDGQVDGLTLIAFDVYMGCREEIYKLSANEVMKQSKRIWERFGLLDEDGSESEKKRKSQQDGKTEA